MLADGVAFGTPRCSWALRSDESQRGKPRGSRHGRALAAAEVLDLVGSLPNEQKPSRRCNKSELL
jgi:hypothetical protein